MISADEYNVFRQLELLFLPRREQLETYRAQSFKLKDGQTVWVRAFNDPVQLYSYCLTSFGVVRILCTQPVKFDKTQMCLELDEILIAELHHAAGL